MVLFGEQSSNKSKKKLNKNKVLKVSIALLCVILLIAFIFFYENNNNVRNFFDTYIFRKMINEENVPSIDIDSSKNINAFAYSKYIAVLEQNELRLYNKLGNQEHSLDIEVSNPLFETNGEYLCIAEKGGQKLYLISNKNILWQKDIEGNISSINVNKNGYVSITISGTSYKTIVQTFSSDGEDLFKNYLGTTNVIDTDISNDNKFLAIAEVNFSGIVVQSNIKIISIEEARENSSESIKYTHVAKANDLIINIKYNNKDDLVCMYDEHIDILTNGENKEIINLTNEDVLFADVNLTSKIVKIIKTSNGFLNTVIEMQTIDSNNTENINRYTIESTPKKVYAQGDIIAINLGTSAIFIQDNGWLVKKYESKKEEIQNIIMCDKIAGVVSKNKIYIISL